MGPTVEGAVPNRRIRYARMQTTYMSDHVPPSTAHRDQPDQPTRTTRLIHRTAVPNTDLGP